MGFPCAPQKEHKRRATSYKTQLLIFPYFFLIFPNFSHLGFFVRLGFFFLIFPDFS